MSINYTAGAWRKATRSGNGGNCVEVRFDGNVVLIRDSKYLRDPANDPAAQPIIPIAVESWRSFLDAAGGSPADGDQDIPSIRRTRDGGAVVQTVDGVALIFTAAEWEAFLAGIRVGEFMPAAV